MNVLITGANRGIGAGFVRHYLSEGAHVWACHRGDSGELSSIRSERLHAICWNVATDSGPREELPAELDLLINNAGIYGPGKDGQSLENVTPEAMLEVFNVDCVGPLRVVKHLRRRLSDGATIANVSSKMGSSGDNSSGGTYAYRAAKAGLAIISRSMAVDLSKDGVRVITLHPGWVRTDMTHQTGLINVETSVAGMANVIANACDYEPGQFIAFDGKVVPY
ncbi:MAG: SDR family NAD(P)-dependent oxidoreductase [Mariprofundaceae bacterium]|nr:SDR family NAD(P)-dependent oxidoreductase [Mariprofundaceae bacterium]